MWRDNIVVGVTLRLCRTRKMRRESFAVEVIELNFKGMHSALKACIPA